MLFVLGNGVLAARGRGARGAGGRGDAVGGQSFAEEDGGRGCDDVEAVARVDGVFVLLAFDQDAQWCLRTERV